MTKPQSHTISVELFDKIDDQLASNRQVRFKLGNNGQLHIDRQLPFLCVYRQPKNDYDAGTDLLILGQAAYLRTSAAPDLQANVSALVQNIIKTQSTLFGGFLLIEIWAEEMESNAESQPVTPAFHVCAPRQRVPNKILDVFENALLDFCLRKQRSDVTISYQDNCLAPGITPLLSKETATQLNCVTLGLGVKPVYRDQTSGEILPFAMNVIRRMVNHALKKVFYSFSHKCTNYRPGHYHELGQRTLTKVVWDSDKKLAEISEKFDLLLYVTPVNVSEAWNAYQQSSYKQIPEFHYRPRSADPTLLKRELYQIPLEKIEDPTLATFFTAKRNELDRQISLLNDRNTPRFLHGSIQLFGEIDAQLLDSAKMLITQPDTPYLYQEDELIDAEQFAGIARSEIEYYRSKDPSLTARVEICNDITGLMVSHGNFLIGSDAHVSKSRCNATLSHEIGTHVLTYHNGKQQPLKQLYAGMAGYEELQEGLAILAEYLTGGLDLSRLQLLAARVIAVHSVISGADFIETFRLLHHDFGFRPYTAFTIAMRVYRGGGYTKDMIYLRGFINLLNYLQAEDEFDLLFCGKIAIEQLPLLEELRWRKVIQPAAIMPRYLSESSAQCRLNKLKAESTLKYVMENL